MRRRSKLALGAAVLVVAVVAAGIPVLVAPATDDPASVDVDIAYVIGPPTDARMEMAYDLIESGRAEVLMVSLDPEEGDRWAEAARACGGEGDGGLAGEGLGDGLPNDEGSGGESFDGDGFGGEGLGSASPGNERLAAGTTVLCAKPDPFTTRGEARWLETEMAEHGWDSAAVITLTPHISRARMIMDRCDTGDIAVVDVGESLAPWFWAYMYAYQAAGFAKAAVLQGC